MQKKDAYMSLHHRHQFSLEWNLGGFGHTALLISVARQRQPHLVIWLCLYWRSKCSCGLQCLVLHYGALLFTHFLDVPLYLL